MPEYSETIEVALPRDRCFEKACDFKAYPRFIPALKSVDVDASDASAPLVTLRLDVPLGEINYTCRYEIRPPGEVSWKMLESNVLKDNHGSWKFEPAGEERCRVTYAMSTKFPVWLAWAVTQEKFAEEIGKTVRRFKAFAEEG
jgi:ribosome-associated toxin RatA of RatAB toxin-antitoxin module